MGNQLLTLIIILIVNTLAAIVYTVIALINSESYERVKVIIQGIVIFICPVIGGAYLFFSWITLKVFFNKPLDFDDISFSDKRVKTMLAPDYLREINMVPVEDAIVLSDKYSLRRLLLDVLKDDRDNSLPAIVLSLSSDDSETSHYAASVLMDVISEFSKTVGALHRKFESDKKKNQGDGIEMILLILYYLSQNLFSEVQAGTYLAMANDAAEVIYADNPLLLRESVMLSLTEAYLKMKGLDGAKVWADRLSIHYADTLQRYTANLKLCYTAGKRNEFFALLDDLKKTDISINYEILMMIRLFNTAKAKAESDGK